MIAPLVLAALLAAAPGARAEAPEAGLGALWEGASDGAFSAHNRAVAHWGMGMYDTAARELESLSAAYPEAAAFRVNLGMVLLSRRRYDESLRRLEQAQARAPESPRLQYLIGRCLIGLEREGEAARRFQRAAELDAREPAFPLAEAEAFSALGRDAEAEKALRRALVLRPEHGPALYRLARSLELRGRKEEARGLLERFAAFKKGRRARLERSRYDDPLEPPALALAEEGGARWLEVEIVPERREERVTVAAFAGRRVRRQEAGAGVLRLPLGSVERVDAVRVDWPDGRHSYKIDVAAGQKIGIAEVATLVW